MNGFERYPEKLSRLQARLSRGNHHLHSVRAPLLLKGTPESLGPEKDLKAHAVQPPAKHGNANIPCLSWKKRVPRSGEDWLYAKKFDPKGANPEQRAGPDTVLRSRCGCSERLQIRPVSASAFTYLLFLISHPVCLVYSRRLRRSSHPAVCRTPQQSRRRKGRHHWGGCAPFIMLSGP